MATHRHRRTVFGADPTEGELLGAAVVYLYDDERRVISAGGALSGRGWEKDLVGKRPEDLLAPEDAEMVNRYLADALAGKAASGLRHSAATGTDYLMDVVPLEHPGRPREVLVISREVTALVERERRLIEAEARGQAALPDVPVARAEVALDVTRPSADAAWATVAGSWEGMMALIEHGADMIAVLDPELRLLYASPAYLSLLGVRPDAAFGETPEGRLHPDDLARVSATLTALAHHPGDVVSFEARLRQGAAGWRTLEVTASNQLANPLIGGLVVNGRDVTERAEAARQLVYEANHDALTGVANRGLFIDELREALGRAGRKGGSCALVLLDMDKFKLVNDNLGHTTGDELLVAIAERLKAVVRPGDAVARVGGDEFAILAEGLVDKAMAVDIAERARRVVCQPVVLRGHDINVSCSVGVAVSGRRTGRGAAPAGRHSPFPGQGAGPGPLRESTTRTCALWPGAVSMRKKGYAPRSKTTVWPSCTSPWSTSPPGAWWAPRPWPGWKGRKGAW